MAYKIGEVAALLGLTPEAIRHYERFGIIEPHKDGQSAYRYFDGWDLILLSACRQYRSLGFSLEDSLHLMATVHEAAVFEAQDTCNYDETLDLRKLVETHWDNIIICIHISTIDYVLTL